MASSLNRALCALVLLMPAVARADEPVIPLPTPVPAPKPLEPTPLPLPTPSDPTPQVRTRFVTDPITDFGIIGLSIGFTGMLQAIIGTGELRPQQPTSKDDLLSIDRSTVRPDVSKSAPMLSNIGVGVAISYAVAAPLISAYRFGGETGWNDAILFAESISLSLSATNLAKIAVRRPRPLAYQHEIDQQRLPPEQRTDVTGTDTALSFFSGHTAITSSIGATATYLAFARSPHTAWPWVIMGASLVTTTFVGHQRVAAGKHFPTDVIAGGLAGAAIGLMVPHLHREQTTKQRHVWVGGGFSDTSGTVSLQGLF
ncbi:MAG: phosphatase PAP2 family protein [Myxococcales bacterium]|nr:MAG: phosphatase PAP2 family protein [Myxococcales bacterium]